MKKDKCIVCKELISMRIVGHSVIIKLCWKHDIIAKNFYKERYHLDGENVKKEIIDIVKETK